MLPAIRVRQALSARARRVFDANQFCLRRQYWSAILLFLVIGGHGNRDNRDKAARRRGRLDAVHMPPAMVRSASPVRWGVNEVNSPSGHMFADRDEPPTPGTDGVRRWEDGFVRRVGNADRKDATSPVMHLDRSRDAVVHCLARELLWLHAGALRHSEDHHRLLLGRKGAVGTSQLLEAVVCVAAGMLPSLVCCHVSYVDGALDLPWDVIARAVRRRGLGRCSRRWSWGLGVTSMRDLEAQLESANVRVLLVVDGLDSAFSSRCSAPAAVPEQLAGLGNSKCGRIMCVATGGSEHLERLCFGLLSKSDPLVVNTYRNYSSVDLNSRKFQPVWIEPMMRQEDCRQGAEQTASSDRRRDAALHCD